jgi:hypothetical protein
VFFLVKLSEDEENAVKNELQVYTDIDESLRDSGDTDDEKDYLFVSWDKEDDGTDVDMVHIAKKSKLGNIIFIDRQSVEDKTVVLTDNQ